MDDEAREALELSSSADDLLALADAGIPADVARRMGLLRITASDCRFEDCRFTGASNEHSANEEGA